MIKSGDLVQLTNIPGWCKSGTAALVTNVVKSNYGTGQIYVIVDGFLGTIPWAARHRYIIGPATKRENCEPKESKCM